MNLNSDDLQGQTCLFWPKLIDYHACCNAYKVFHFIEGKDEALDKESMLKQKIFLIVWLSSTSCLFIQALIWTINIHNNGKQTWKKPNKQNKTNIIKYKTKQTNKKTKKHI